MYNVRGEIAKGNITGKGNLLFHIDDAIIPLPVYYSPRCNSTIIEELDIIEAGIGYEIDYEDKHNSKYLRKGERPIRLNQAEKLNFIPIDHFIPSYDLVINNNLHVHVNSKKGHNLNQKSGIKDFTYDKETGCPTCAAAKKNQKIQCCCG